MIITVLWNAFLGKQYLIVINFSFLQLLLLLVTTQINIFH